MHCFTPRQRSKLLANRNVQNITEKYIFFTTAFKIKAINEYFSGKDPKQIFQEAGIPIEYFKDHYCRLCIREWVKKFQSEGEDSFHTDNRGKGSTGRPKNEKLDDLTYEELLTLVEIQKGALEELKKQKALEKKKY